MYNTPPTRERVAQMERQIQTQQTILVVDDDPAIRSWLRDMLEDELYSVAVATNGRDALNYVAANEPPCLILLDLMMPVMNGYEFLRERQLHRQLNKVPIVLFSAFAAPADPAATFGVVDYLPKPVNVHRLLAILERFCESAQSN